MKRICLFLLLMIQFVISTSAYAEDCDRFCQKSLIDDYFNYLAAVYREGSSESDVDQLFKILHHNVKYEHIEYKANFDFDEWKDAFKNNLKRGAYTAEEKDGIRVEDYIFGKNYVAIEYSYGYLSSEGEWQPKGDQQLLALFGFTNNKISLVREYW